MCIARTKNRLFEGKSLLSKILRPILHIDSVSARDYGQSRRPSKLSPDSVIGTMISQAVRHFFDYGWLRVPFAYVAIPLSHTKNHLYAPLIILRIKRLIVFLESSSYKEVSLELNLYTLLWLSRYIYLKL